MRTSDAELRCGGVGDCSHVRVGAGGEAPPAIGTETVLFRAPYLVAPNTMYDVSPDGQRFVIVRQ